MRFVHFGFLFCILAFGLVDARALMAPDENLVCLKMSGLDFSDFVKLAAKDLDPRTQGHQLAVLKRTWEGLPLTIGNPNDPEGMSLDFEQLFKAILERVIKCSTKKFKCPDCPSEKKPSAQDFATTKFSFDAFTLETSNTTLSYALAGSVLIIILLVVALGKDWMKERWNAVKMRYSYVNASNVPGTVGSDAPVDSNNPRNLQNQEALALATGGQDCLLDANISSANNSFFDNSGVSSPDQSIMNHSSSPLLKNDPSRSGDYKKSNKRK